MATIRFPFNHAIQYSSNGSSTTQTTVTSGNLKLGYDKASNYSTINQYGSPHYWVEMYFDVPADIYKYTCNAYMRHNFKATVASRRYEYATFPAHPEDNFYSNYDSSYDTDDYRFNPSNYNECSTKFYPDGLVSNYPFLINEDTIKRTQIYVPDSYLVNTFYTGEYVDKGITYETDNAKFYERDSYLVTFKDIENFYLEFDASIVYSIITPVYPVNVYVRNDRDLTVSWEASNSKNRSSDYIYIEDSEIIITDSNSNSITASITGSDSIYVFDEEDVGTLAVGSCFVSVTANDNYGNTAVESWEFDLVGETNAPEITSVTQNSYPTITWTSTSQIAWELQISNASGIVYKTGMTVGNETSYTVPKLLEDGEYSLEMRCINTYGVVTAWSSYFLNLQPTKPDAPENIIVSARADFGISVACGDITTTGKLLAVRRKDSDSEPEVLGEYNGSFVDYLVGLNDSHEYTIRNYVEGYADGVWVDGTLAYSGVIIRDAQDYSRFVRVWMSENDSLRYIYNDDRDETLTKCVGRKFPVSEIGEWLTTTRSFVGYVSDEDFKKLQKMKTKSTHILMQSKEEYFPCSIEYADQGEYINDGRLVSFQLTRIDGEK